MHQSSDKLDERKSRTALASLLRDQIVHGQYEPGARLPTRDFLVGQLGASKHTVQSALARLEREGFVVSRTKAGTFVVDRPPHLTRYALVFPMRVNRSRFYEALREAAHAVAAVRGIAFVEFDQELDQDMERLRDNAREHLLAGAVFVHPIHRMWSSPMMTEPGAPKVLIQSSTTLPLPDLHVDMDSFYRRAFALCRDGARRRLAVIFNDAPWGTWTPERFAREAAAHGLSIAPYWLAPLGGQAPGSTAAFAARALMAMQGRRRPDALIVADDNLVTAVAGGLMSSGVRVPQDVLVVAHCNHPLPVEAPGLPVTHLGFDCGALLERSLLILAAQRAQQPVDPAWLTPLPAQTVDELRGAAAASTAVREQPALAVEGT